MKKLLLSEVLLVSVFGMSVLAGGELRWLKPPRTTDVTCANARNGTINVPDATWLAGGTPPYKVSLDGVDFHDLNVPFTGLVADTYIVTAEDSDPAGAEVDTTVVVQEPNQIWVTVKVTPVSFNGGRDGVIALTTVTGGNGDPAQYTWSIGTFDAQGNEIFQPVSQPFTNLEAQTYSAVVIDQRQCVSPTVKVSVRQPQRISSTYQVKDATNGAANGVITLEKVTGGAGDYADYTWSIGTVNSSGQVIKQPISQPFTGLAPSAYQLTVYDANDNPGQTHNAFVDNGSAQPSTGNVLTNFINRKYCSGSANPR